MARRGRSTGWGILGLALAIAWGFTARGAAQDSDGDGLGDAFERAFDDTDRDQVPDELDRDDDGDGLDTSEELGPTPGAPLDTDGDTKPDYRDFDDDGDGVSTLDERSITPEADGNANDVPAYLDALEVGPYVPDADRDGILDNLDEDDDADGVPDLREQAGDSDGDGKLDRVDADDDGDGIATNIEQPNPAPGRDTDGDGKADYLDADDDGDGLPTRAEQPDPNHDGMVDDARVTSGSTPDYLNGDDDNDELPTRDERPGGASRDSDGDGIFDHLDRDDDGDGRDTSYEVMRDSDGDGITDHLDSDDDGDGILTGVESSSTLLLDFDGDGLQNYLDLDSDGDGKSDEEEGLLDRDGNGAPDYLDAPARDGDSDGDGVSDARECPIGSTSCPDSDLDGQIDSQDPDDDGDGLSTRDESGQTARDSDADGKPDYLDSDDDGDGIATRDEGAPSRDTDRDGIPDYLDASNDASSDAGGTTADAGGIDSGPPIVTVSTGGSDGCSLAAGRARHPSLLLCIGIALLIGLGRRPRALALLTTLALVSCGDDEPGGVSILDASLDARAPEAGVDLDAGDAASSSDGALDGGLSSECAGDLLGFSSIRGEGRSFSAAIDGNRAHLAFLVAACGDVGSVEGARNFRYLSFATTGEASSPIDLLPDGCAAPRDPTLISEAQGSASLFYGAWGEASFELFYRAPPSAESSRVQTSSLARELASVAAVLASAEPATVAYALQSPSSSIAPTSIETLQVGRASLELLGESAGQRAIQLGMAPLGGSSGTQRGVVAWLSDSAASPGVYARLVDLRGAGQGELLTLTRAVGSEGAVAVATRKAGAAVIYTELRGVEGYELRFRTLSSTGELGAQVALTGGNERIGDIAIAAHRNGYAVAYRRLASALNSESSVRLLFLDPDGNVGGSRFVANAAPSGTGLLLLSALDGRLFVIWDGTAPVLDGGAAATLLDLQAARLTCN